jgi:HEAT repeat protein
MRKQGILIALSLCVAIVLIAVLTQKEEPEPSYDGHPLSYWIVWRGYYLPAERTRPLREIGPSALPFLLKWIQYEPAPWRDKLASRMPNSPRGRAIALRLVNPRAQTRAYEAAFGLHCLGYQAKPAIPELVRLMNKTNHLQTALRATEALAYTGTDALPPLLAVIQNQTHPCRATALNMLVHMPVITDAGRITVPAVINCLLETNDATIPVIAATALGDLKTAPELSVPALLHSLQSPDPKLRRASAFALIDFGDQAASAIPALTEALKDPDPPVRDAAAFSLRRIAPAKPPDEEQSFTFWNF